MALTTVNTGALVAPAVTPSQREAAMAQKELEYTITRPCFVEGVSKKVGDKVTLPEGTGNYLVAINKAVKGSAKVDAPLAAAKK